ncbi:MAG: hypothetical protein CL773_01160 [Chloroflexi bacterium]|nr:hypothetical protein [Chloroflexota bacterium]|tara:strand:- start:19272 stop:19820 length:549 start_codon:yes stop_codon:yes gene_type:complete
MSDSAIFKRNSSVNFSPQELSKEDIDSIIQSSIWAPSSRNLQPWKIIAVKRSSSNFVKLIKAMSEGNQEWAKNSGLIMIFCTENDQNISPKTFLNIGFSGENAMIRSAELGLQSHPIGGWDEEKVKEISKIPNYSQIAFLLVIGKEGNVDNLSKGLLEKHKQKRERNPLNKNFNYDEWGKNF